MPGAGQAYGDMLRIASGGGAAETLRRVAVEANAADGGVQEEWLRDRLFEYPQALPLRDIDASYAGAIPVCTELHTPSGRIDALYVNPLGRLTLAEFKLWRNPQGRREVIGQILDYAKDLAAWSYEDLQREVSRRRGETGNVLYQLARQQSPELSEPDFVDTVTRHLRRGEFLLLIVGDGIREGTENIVNFVNQHAGLHFNLALVEAALYRDAADTLFIQPRILAKTEIIPHLVYELAGTPETPTLAADDDDEVETHSDQEEQNLRFWTAVLKDFVFSDVTVAVPGTTTRALNTVRIGFSGMRFRMFLDRKSPAEFGCYLSCRQDFPQALRIFEELASSLEELQGEMGEDLDTWTISTGNRRIGFKRRVSLAFLSESEAQAEYREAVEWMRTRLDRLVSGLNPRIQRLRQDGA